MTNNLVINILVFSAACVLLMHTTKLFVCGAVDTALALSLSKVFIGVTLVSIITTLPEFTVSVMSSLMKKGEVAVGTAVGSCICNIGLVFGVGAAMRNIRVERNDLTHNIGFFVIGLVALFLLSLDGKISRAEGVGLLAAAALFMYISYRQALRARTAQAEIVGAARGGSRLTKSLALVTVGGIATVLIARYGLLGSAINIARELNVPPVLIAFSIIALGTSLPELFTAIVSSRSSQGDITLGNVIGANVLNILWVIGAASAICPLNIDRQTVVFNFPVALFISVVMYLIGRSKLLFTRIDGFVLLSIYAGYIWALYYIIYR
jgi:cation:H+ antiporter